MNVQEVQFRNSRVPFSLEPTSFRQRAAGVAEVAATEAEAVDREARFPKAAIDAARQQRLLGAQIPTEFGGDGASIAEVTDMCFVRQRAAVGHGPRGLQPGRGGVGLPAARSRPVPRLPVGRGRAGRVLRRRAAAVPGPGPVERPRPDPEGAGLRADRRAGQPRRGRQGVLVVPGRDPQPRLEPVALPLPAGRVPVPGPDRRQRARATGTSPSTSWSTPGCSTRTATGSSRCTTPRPTPTTC